MNLPFVECTDTESPVLPIEFVLAVEETEGDGV